MRLESDSAAPAAAAERERARLQRRGWGPAALRDASGFSRAPNALRRAPVRRSEHHPEPDLPDALFRLLEVAGVRHRLQEVRVRRRLTVGANEQPRIAELRGRPEARGVLRVEQ